MTSSRMNYDILGFDEALTLVTAGRWEVTSPNMKTIPFFPIERVSVRPRLDGRLGDEDFTLSPQIFSRLYPHRILLRRFPGDNTDAAAMWWTPTLDNFVPLTNSSYKSLGRVHSSRVKIIDALTWSLRNRAYSIIAENRDDDLAALSALISGMRHGVTRMRYSPYTFRELVLDVAQTQRLYLEALAMCDFLEDRWDRKLNSVGPIKTAPHREFMGAWTSDPSVVQQLYQAGIPVYFVRPMGIINRSSRIIRVQSLCRRDEKVETADWSPTALPERYSGLPGDDMHRASSELNRYGDLDKYFLDIDTKQDVVPVGERGTIVMSTPSATKKRTKNRWKSSPAPEKTLSVADNRLRDKWLEITGDFIPLTIPHWSKALRLIDRSQRQSKAPPKHYCGYRFPDPGMLVFSEGRRERNLFGWLLIRDANIRRVTNDISSSMGVPGGVSNELWRMILGVQFSDEDKLSVRRQVACRDAIPLTRATSNSDRRRAALSIFGRPPDTHNVCEVEWRGHMVPWDTFFHHDPMLVQEILWDVHQYSFQYDIIALDHYHCTAQWSSEPQVRQDMISGVLGGNDCFVVDNSPEKNVGIASDDEAERLAAYRSLDQLMQQWPPTSNIPSKIAHPPAFQEAVAAACFAKAFASKESLSRNVRLQEEFR
ncbi:hypothetical protein HWV62_1989 [Athelia sp. TMB]|nr:hypothetical protein HWV62_1989 [Athelia sp. TMB]